MLNETVEYPSYTYLSNIDDTTVTCDNTHNRTVVGFSQTPRRALAYYIFIFYSYITTILMHGCGGFGHRRRERCGGRAFSPLGGVFRSVNGSTLGYV